MTATRPSNAGRRRAFSLIELLIVVAIIAAIVGVAVPFFRGNIQEANEAKVGQDLDTLVSAIDRYRQDTGSQLVGSSLTPLVGKVLQELPKDPWGNAYVFDGNLCLVGTFGANGVQGGDHQDKDLFRQYRTHVQVLAARVLKGGLGIPKPGATIEIRLSKPVMGNFVNPAVLADEVVFLPPVDDPLPLPASMLGFEFRPEDLPLLGEGIVRLTRAAGIPAITGYALAQGTRVTFSGMNSSFFELPAPPAETMIVDPTPYLWGPEDSMRPDGSWSGASLTL